MAAQDLSPLWESALSEYQTETKRKQQLTQLDALRSIMTLEQLLVSNEASGKASKDFRGKHPSVWGTLKLFVSPPSALLTIAGMVGSDIAGRLGITASAVLVLVRI